MILLPTALGLLGLLVGPALGVVVDRAVERLRLRPQHRCTRCERDLGPRSLVPVVSWWQLCPSGDHRKGLRYPLVDLTTAVTFAAIGVRFEPGVELGLYLALGAVLVVLSVIDAETHLLPNIIVWPSIWAGLFAVFVVSGQAGDPGRLQASLWGAVAFGGFVGAVHLVNEQGMGRGDVKLSVLLGLFLGWLQSDLLVTVLLVLYTLVLASGVGLATALVLRWAGRARGEIPFGPALAAATLVLILASPALAPSS